MARTCPPSDAPSRPTGARSPSAGRALEVVVVGASAGGVGALRGLVAALPGDLGACVLVVLHMPTTARSALAEVLGRALLVDGIADLISRPAGRPVP